MPGQLDVPQAAFAQEESFNRRRSTAGKIAVSPHKYGERAFPPEAAREVRGL
jgi:hypothetical protein